MTIYRLHRSARAASDYTGAMLAGGRWNAIGTPMLYAAQHLSLACLEVLVHVDKAQIPRDYTWSKAELPVPIGHFRFDGLGDIRSCQAAGTEWVRTFVELAVQVPSVVIPEEFNVLVNPLHGSYGDLRWTAPRPFRFNPRLFVAEPLPV